MQALLIVRRVLATVIATTCLAAGGTTVAEAVRPDVTTGPVQRADLPVPVTSTVTVDQLGADSVVAVVSRGNFDRRDAPGLRRSLEVVTPDGTRHSVYSVDLAESPLGWFHGDFLLADWRPELHTALLRVSLGPDGDVLVSYAVTTGDLREVGAPRRASFVALDPAGAGVLMTTYPSRHRAGRVAILGWNGIKTWLPARAGAGAITSIDGTSLVTDVGAKQRWWITDLASRTSRVVDTPGWCRPHRWADADSVIATCDTRRGSQLRRVDLDGTSSRLGIRHRSTGRDSTGPIFNDEDVRVVHGRSWFESYGGCGGGILTRQTPAGKVHVVRVPGRRAPVALVGTRGESLVLARGKGDCGVTGSRAALTLFDPVSKAATLVTRLARDEDWREVLPATEVRSWIW